MNRLNDFSIEAISITPAAPSETLEAMAAIWNAACEANLATSSRLIAYNLAPVPAVHKLGWIVHKQDQPKGFVLASHAPSFDPGANKEAGWIDAIAVAPDAQGEGLGGALLELAERGLSAAGCRHAQLGAGLRPLMPGLATTLGSSSFFSRRGYRPPQDEDQPVESVWDVAADLAYYRPSESAQEAACTVRPARPADQEALLELLNREFPGRWTFECDDYLRSGGRISDYMLLWSERGLDGFCRLAFEDSLQPLERFYPYQLRRPWGQLGPIGVSKTARGQGLGSALMHAGLRRLHNNGVNGCIIDWTTLVDFYARFGFKPYREYLVLARDLE